MEVKGVNFSDEHGTYTSLIGEMFNKSHILFNVSLAKDRLIIVSWVELESLSALTS